MTADDGALDVGRAIREGVDRTLAPAGRRLVAAFLAVGLANVVVSGTVQRANAAVLARLPDAPDLTVGPTPYALPVGLPAALALALALALVAEAARIVAVRTFASAATDRIPGEFLWRDITRATLDGFVAGVIVLALVGLGTLLLIVPGVFLSLVFLFVRQEVAVEGENAIDAMAGSWYLTAGHRWSLLALGLVVVAASLAASLPVLALSLVAPAVAPIVGAALSSVTVVFGTAITTRAYAQLRAARSERRVDAPGPFE